MSCASLYRKEKTGVVVIEFLQRVPARKLFVTFYAPTAGTVGALQRNLSQASKLAAVTAPLHSSGYNKSCPPANERTQ